MALGAATFGLAYLVVGALFHPFTPHVSPEEFRQLKAAFDYEKKYPSHDHSQKRLEGTAVHMDYSAGLQWAAPFSVSKSTVRRTAAKRYLKATKPKTRKRAA